MGRRAKVLHNVVAEYRLELRPNLVRSGCSWGIADGIIQLVNAWSDDGGQTSSSENCAVNVSQADFRECYPLYGEAELMRSRSYLFAQWLVDRISKYGGVDPCFELLAPLLFSCCAASFDWFSHIRSPSSAHTIHECFAAFGSF